MSAMRFSRRPKRAVFDIESHAHFVTFSCYHRYYPFNVYTPKKAVEKLEYMHNNSVCAGLVKEPCAWPWSSARYFLQGKPSPLTLVPMDGPIVLMRSGG